jgi:hypothetical protein
MADCLAPPSMSGIVSHVLFVLVTLVAVARLTGFAPLLVRAWLPPIVEQVTSLTGGRAPQVRFASANRRRMEGKLVLVTGGTCLCESIGDASQLVPPRDPLIHVHVCASAGNRGCGRALAKGFAELGASVIIGKCPAYSPWAT